MPYDYITFTIYLLCRSSEEALEILLKFKHIKTRAAIQQQLLKKFDPILDQFIKEVATIEKTFSVSY